jgi:hypothetical protein
MTSTLYLLKPQRSVGSSFCHFGVQDCIVANNQKCLQNRSATPIDSIEVRVEAIPKVIWAQEKCALAGIYYICTKQRPAAVASVYGHQSCVHLSRLCRRNVSAALEVRPLALRRLLLKVLPPV